MEFLINGKRVKAAVYRNSGPYNIASNGSSFQGTDFGAKYMMISD